MPSSIKIEKLWKEYRLGVIGHGTLTQDLQSWWAKVRGKEDPNSILNSMAKEDTQQFLNGRFWALRDINIEVQEGEVLGLIGKNGAGKSTLLKILSRVTAPTHGNIYVKGRIASLLEVGTGFHPELTGSENIFMNGAILGMSKREIMSKRDEIIDFSGVENYIDTPVKRYSSGMRVRLAFAVAAHLEPEILVVDEVLAVGDVEFQQKCLGKMKSVSSQGRTILFVSHNMAAVKQLCDRAIILEQGKAGFEGSAGDAVDNYITLNNTSDDIAPEANVEIDKNKRIQITRISVSDMSNKVKNIFEYTEKIQINIDVLKADELLPTSIRAVLTDWRGNTIFVTTSDDIEPMNLHSFSSGNHKVSFNIPDALLLPGKYTLSTTIRGYRELKPYDKHERIVGFEVVDNNTSRGKGGNISYRSHTMVAPAIAWRN